jgi:hypothetical protein
MRAALFLLALGLMAASAAAAQDNAPAAVRTPANPYRDLFTRWDGANRESLEAEVARVQPAPAPDTDHIPAYSPLVPRAQAEAIALGERVGAVVRAGNCAEGERIARAAGDFPLVRAVRDHCRSPR